MRKSGYMDPYKHIYIYKNKYNLYNKIAVPYIYKPIV